MTRNLSIKRSLLSVALAAAMLAVPLHPLAYAVDEVTENELIDDEFTISVPGNKGVDLDDTELVVKRGESTSVTATPATGFEITKVQPNDGTHMETAPVGTGQLLVAGKVYCIDEANGRVALRLTNVQSDMEVSFIA